MTDLFRTPCVAIALPDRVSFIVCPVGPTPMGRPWRPLPSPLLFPVPLSEGGVVITSQCCDMAQFGLQPPTPSEDHALLPSFISLIRHAPPSLPLNPKGPFTYDVRTEVEGGWLKCKQ